MSLSDQRRLVNRDFLRKYWKINQVANKIDSWELKEL